MKIYDPLAAPSRAEAAVSNDASPSQTSGPEPLPDSTPVAESNSAPTGDTAQTATASSPNAEPHSITITKAPEPADDADGEDTPPVPASSSVLEVLSSGQTAAQPADDTNSEDTRLKPFPIDTLPASIGRIVAAVALAERVPASLPAIAGLGVLSGALGAGIAVASSPTRVTHGNLFLLASADSGSGKSETFRHIAKPLYDHQAKQLEIWHQKTNPQLKSEIAVLAKEIAALEKKAARATNGEERERLRGELEFKIAKKDALERRAAIPCVIAQDVTTERLAVLIGDNRETMFSASADARKVIDNLMGRYSPSKTTDESLYLSAYSRDYVRVDRQGRDPVILHHPCLALFWFVQPDMFATMFEVESLSASGFLPRCLICHTGAVPRKIEADAPTISDATRKAWDKTITDLLATFHTALEPVIIKPMPRAKSLLDGFHNAIVGRRQGDLADVGVYAARYAEQAWRVSVVLHAALHGADAGKHPLDAETAANAIRIVRWFMRQQLNLLQRGRIQAQQKLEDEVFSLIERREERTQDNEITARDVHHARIVETPEAAAALLERMKSNGMLVSRDVKPERGGRATRKYRPAEKSNPVPG